MATGGNNIYTIDVNGQSYRVHEFTESGTFTPAVTLSLEYLIVAGGGAGGGNGGYAGGGGGAGGLLSGNFGPANGGQDYSIVVGSGGTPQSLEANKNDAKGGNSIAFGVTAYGGGGGSFIDSSTSPATGVSPTSGGSGGGGGGQILSRTFNGAPELVAGQGRAGGNGEGSNITLDNQSGGGGGGYNGVGQNGVDNNGGDGGPGITSDITGSTVYYSAGGGGGTRNGTGGNGGTGGGGDAGAINAVGEDGQTYGSGGGSGSSNVGGSGANGIVIVRYAVTDVDISATSLTASAESFDASIVGNSGFEPNSVTASAELLSPTVVAIIGDSVNITTFIQVNASFPSNYSVSTQNNVFNNISVTLDASATFPDLINIASTTDNSFAAESATATAEIIEPLQQAFPMAANAELLEPTLNIDESLYRLITSKDPHIYIDFGSYLIENEGSLTDLYTEYTTFDNSNNTGGPIVDADVDLTGKLAAISDGTGWRFNDNNALRLDTYETNAGLLSGEFFQNVNNSNDWTIEFWINPSYEILVNGSEVYNTFRIGTRNFYLYTTSGFNPNVQGQNRTLAMYVGGLEPYLYGFDAGNQPIYRDYVNTGFGFELNYNNWNYLAFGQRDNGDGTNNIFAISNNVVIYNSVFEGKTDMIRNGNDDEVYFNIGYGTNISNPIGSFKLDHFALHNRGLELNELIDHYDFVDSLSPDNNFNTSAAFADASLVDPFVTSVFNVEFPQDKFTAIANLTEPLITARQNISTTANLMTASAEAVDETFAGTPDYRDLPEPMVAFAEEAGGYHLSDVYYEYIQQNITPYRYVSFDGSPTLADDGTDNDYSVPAVVVNGTIVEPSDGITGRAARTSGGLYSSDGIYLMESEHDDDWGTGTDEYHSSFWMQRGSDDISSGLRILWNLNGAFDDQHVILYQYQGKLHLNFNNGSGTFIDQATVDDIDLFDFNRHFVAINFDHTGVNNFVKLFVDGFEAMEVDLGQYTGQTINSDTFLAPNDPANNFPRVSLGGLITPFAITSLPVVPTNIEMVVDEIVWAKTPIDATTALALFNLMPDKTNQNYFATAATASAEIFDPEIITNVEYQMFAFNANSEFLDPALTVEFENIFVVDDNMEAAAEMLNAERVEEINFVSPSMVASAFTPDSTVGIGVFVRSFNATAKIADEALRINTVLIASTVLSQYIRHIAYNSSDTIIPNREVV